MSSIGTGVSVSNMHNIISHEFHFFIIIDQKYLKFYSIFCCFSMTYQPHSSRRMDECFRSIMPENRLRRAAQ